MPELSSALPDPPAGEDPTGRDFPIVRRGFDQDAVRAYLVDVASALRKLRADAALLQARLEDAEARAAAPVLDEATLTAAVGTETARILHTANEAAREVLSRAETKAADMQAEAASILGERTREAEAETRVIAGRARAEAAGLIESTKAECRAMVEEARDARRRILADLADRRRLLHLQLEQLRAGKDSLAEVVEVTARSVEGIVARLAGSEIEARAAADRAAERTSFDDETSLEALVEASFVLASPGVAGAETAGVSEEAGDDAHEAIDLPDLVGGDGRTSSDGAVDEVVDATVLAVVVDGPGAAGGTTAIAAGGVIDLDIVEIDDTGYSAADPSSVRVPAAGGESEGTGVASVATESIEPEGQDDEGPSDEPTEAVGSGPPAPPIDSEGVEAAPAVAGGEPAQPPGPSPNPAGDAVGPSVDDLFARIRAGRVEPSGPTGPSPSRDEATPSGATSRGESSPIAQGGLATAVMDDLDLDDVTDDGLRLDGDDAALSARAELLAPIMLDLSRTLKRELRSDQNVLLDALRGLQRGAEASGLVPGDETIARLAAATSPMLAASWRAGHEFGGGAASAATSPGPEVVRVANELADEVVSSLRARLEHALDAVEEDGTTAELVGAAYRQWRGERVDDLAGHYTAMLFSVGVMSGASSSSLVHWVVDDGTDPCPDCDDNALAGPQAAGEPFPTGQQYPPVHPGCRCMLVPTDA